MLTPHYVAGLDTKTLIDKLQSLRTEATWIEVSELKFGTPEYDEAVDIAININVINQELKKRIKEQYR